jgi:6-phosphogluconate dehydrogenase
VDTSQFELGLVGLGVMGRNFLQNLGDHGYKVAGYDKNENKTTALQKEAGDKPIGTADSVSHLVRMLRTPRAVLMLVPAGAPVDSVIDELLPCLEPGDVIVDGGNSHFEDTNLRARKAAESNLAYLGVGISGGEYGARHGPSIMPGGPREGYARVAPMLESAAAKVDGQPCVAYLGPGSAGHYVKMVHNGIEYGLMQLLAECYDLMKRGLGFSDERLADVYGQWNDGELAGYLIEITSRIFRREDPRTDEHLIDRILDEARQKGTGMWTSQNAMELQIPVPTIDTAVAMRNMSALKKEREQASQRAAGLHWPSDVEPESFVKELGRALLASTVVTYTQGMALLRRASDEYEYELNLAEVARIWRGGCIIRGALLEDMRTTLERHDGLPNLLLDSHFQQKVDDCQQSWRSIVQTAVRSGIPVPAMAASLSYFDAYRSRWLPANLIEAQRDFFGSHTFERIDAKGTFHVEWSRPEIGSTQKHAAAAGGCR